MIDRRSLPEILRSRAWEDRFHRKLREQAAFEIERLQAIIDSRPAINAGLPDSYIHWSQAIYEIEFQQAMGKSN